MVPLFIVKDENSDIKAGFYVKEEAIRFIHQVKEVYKISTEDWTWEESVLGNNADKLSEAMFK